MGAFSIWHWVIVLIVVLILFGGKGKLSSIMGDFGKGLKNFKDQVKSNKEVEEEMVESIPFARVHEAHVGRGTGQSSHLPVYQVTRPLAHGQRTAPVLARLQWKHSRHMER